MKQSNSALRRSVIYARSSRACSRAAVRQLIRPGVCGDRRTQQNVNVRTSITVAGNSSPMSIRRWRVCSENLAAVAFPAPGLAAHNRHWNFSHVLLAFSSAEKTVRTDSGLLKRKLGKFPDSDDSRRVSRSSERTSQLRGLRRRVGRRSRHIHRSNRMIRGAR